MFVIALLLFQGMFMEGQRRSSGDARTPYRRLTAFGVVIHFGVIAGLLLRGQFTPRRPSAAVFIASGIADTTLEDIFYNTLPLSS